MAGTANKELLESLSRTSGVDFKGLKAKYEAKAKEQSSQGEQATVPQASAEGLERLNNYCICKGCNGKGTVKTIYNHMVMERDCEECDGESIVLSSQGLAAIKKGLA
jgi:DnaJ-class molecular chaperone